MSETAIPTGQQRALPDIGRVIGRVLGETGPLIVLLLLGAILWATSPAFRSPTSLSLLALEAAAIGIVSAGQTFVILTSGIDLSVEAMVSFSGVVAAILIAGTNVAGGQIALGVPSIVAIIAALGAGLLIGLFQGVIITALKINPFIVTLGFRSILLGVALVVTNGAGINIQKDGFLDFITSNVTIDGATLPFLLSGALLLFIVFWYVQRHSRLGRAALPIGERRVPLLLLAGVAVYIVALVTLLPLLSNPPEGSRPLRIPVPFIICLLVYFVSWIALRHAKFGRYTYAIGGNETAAQLSGINVNMIKVWIYGISGLCAAIAGVLVMGRLRSGAYQNGTDMTLISVAAVVIGGTALTGGVGGIWGTLVGVFIIRIVNQGLVYLNVQSNTKEIVIGAIIVIAVAVDVLRRGEIEWLRRLRPRDWIGGRQSSAG